MPKFTLLKFLQILALVGIPTLVGAVATPLIGCSDLLGDSKVPVSVSLECDPVADAFLEERLLAYSQDPLSVEAAVEEAYRVDPTGTLCYLAATKSYLERLGQDKTTRNGVYGRIVQRLTQIGLEKLSQ